MNTKLTLTIDHSLIEKAKKYAKAQGRSLSDIVENYLKVIIKEQHKHVLNQTPITSSLRGTFSASKDHDDRKELSKALFEKYL